MKAKQIICILLAFSLIFSGCSRKASEETVQNLKGRYVEKNIDLPKDMTADSMMLIQKDNKPVLYGFLDNPITIAGYQLNSDGTWTEITPAWLKSLTSLPEGWSYRPQLMEDANGYQYLYYNELINGNLKGNLLRSKDGTTYEVIQPEGWDDTNPDYGFYHNPSKVTVLGDGTLAAIFYDGEVITYDNTDYKIKNTISDRRYLSEFISSMGNDLILGESDDSYTVNGIDVYHPGDLSSSSYPFEATINSNVYCEANSNMDLLLCNADGIFKLENGTSVWNTVLDGTLSSLSMPTLWLAGFTFDSSGNYYVLYNSDSRYSMKRYVFDETVDSLPDNELNLYSLTDSNILRQAAAVFQQDHTDVKINFNIAMTPEEYRTADTATKEDYIRALNTELIAGSDYDILVLDGLPAEAFTQKGILADMSDLVSPMVEDGTLFGNIMGNYTENNKIYRVPARLFINLLFSRTKDTKQLTTVDALAEYAAANRTRPLFGNMTIEELVNTFTPYLRKEILNSDGKINRDGLVKALNNLKQISDNCGIAESNDNAGIGNNLWNLNRGIDLYLDAQMGFLDAMYAFGMVTHVNGCYASFENSFTPGCELGINSKSKQLELSKEFIRTVLSEKVQTNDLYDGFPINSRALIAVSQLDRSNYSSIASVTDEDGGESRVTFEALDQAQIKDVVDICSAVTVKITADDHIASVIAQKAKDFLSGSQTAGDAADAIIAALDVYLSE